MHTHKQHAKSHVHYVGNVKSITSSPSLSSSSSSSAIFTTRTTSPLPKLNRTELSVDEPISPICTPQQRLHEELERQEQHENQCASLTFVYNDADLSEVYITRRAIFCRINVSAVTSVLHGVLTLDAADLLWLYELTLPRQCNNTQNNTEYVIKGKVEDEDNSCASPLPLHSRGKSAMSSTSTSSSSSSTFRISTPLKVEIQNQITVSNTLPSEGYENESKSAAIPRSVKMYTISPQCDSNDTIRNENLYSADSDVKATKQCSLTNRTTTTTTISPTETTETAKDLLEDMLENGPSREQTNKKISTKINAKKEHGLLSRIFDLSTRWVSHYNDNDNNVTNTINTNGGNIIIDKTQNCKTNHDFTYNTIALCHKDGLPNVQTIALVMEMIYDEHIQRAAIECTEMNERLTTHHEYTVNLHTQIGKEVNTFICNHNAIYAAELSRNAVERVQVLESALRNSLVSSCMTTYLHLDQLKAEEGRDVLLMSTAHEYADKLEEARFQIRVKHSRHLRAVDELQQAQIKCLALMPSLAIMSEEDNKNTNDKKNERLKANKSEQHYCLEEKSRYHEYQSEEELEKPKSNVAMCALKELLYSIDNAIDLLTDDGCQTNEPTVTPLPPSLKQALHDRFATI